MQSERSPRRELLWDLSGKRCAICHRSLVRRGEPAGPDQLPGIEWLITNATPPTDGYSDFVLLCQPDAVTVETNAEHFPEGELRRLKEEVEQLFASRLAASSGAAGGPAVRLLVHVAVFIGSAIPFYFLKVLNDSLTEPIRINDVWFETNPITRVINPQRRLPAMLESGDTFETWIAVQRVPEAENILCLARVRLGDGSVIQSLPNTAFAPAGLVGGGGLPLSEVYVDQRYVNSADPSKWDVFISYASEDRRDVAQPLYQELTRLGLKVWYDDSTMQIGDSLRRRIDQGLANSAFCVVIVSPAYIRKAWPQYEFDGIISSTVAGKQRLLPIWHQITADQVRSHSPALADKIARNTQDHQIVDIAREIAQRIRQAGTQD
jgi:hypothetical protein